MIKKGTSFLSFAAYFISFRHNWRLHRFFSLYVIFALSMIRFIIIRLGIAALFIILQQLKPLLLAKVQILLPEFFCEGTMQLLSVF